MTHKTSKGGTGKRSQKDTQAAETEIPAETEVEIPGDADYNDDEPDDKEADIND